MNRRSPRSAPTPARRDRRVHRSAASRRRLSRTAAVLFAVGAALFGTSLFFVQPSGAKGAITVSPNTGLSDGQQVTVSWTGLTPNFSPAIEQCKTNPVSPTQDCDFLTLVISTSDGQGAGTETFNVFTGLGPSKLFACDNQNDCSIRVADDPNDVSSGTTAVITFSTAATTTSSTSTSSTSSSSTSSTSSSSTSSTSSTSSSSTSSTSSTSLPDDSTTSTSSPTEVLGDTTSSGSGGSSDGSGLVLAFTGTALHLPYTLFGGAALLVAGVIVRRLAYRGL
jgi:hypothetical protein